MIEIINKIKVELNKIAENNELIKSEKIQYREMVYQRQKK